MAAPSAVPFSSIPRANAGRDTNADLAILVFLRTPLTVSQWQTLLDAADSDAETGLRTRIRHATGASELAFVHAQPLDRQPDDDGDATAAVLELLVHTGHESLTMEDCRRFRQHETLDAWEAAHDADIVMQPTALYHAHARAPADATRPAGLAVFDMDSTLIQQEVIDELARAVGRYAAVAAITEAAMRGEAPYTDFAASLRARVALLAGVPGGAWAALRRDVITFTPGARELAGVLRARGWKTAVLSGGFAPLATWVRDALGLDYAVANHLVADAATGALTGELEPGRPIVDAARKRELLRRMAADHGVPVARTIAVGDGSNDLLMMHAAGLGVAFNAKPPVQRAAPAKLNRASLLDVLYVLGFTKDEVTASLASGTTASRG